VAALFAIAFGGEIGGSGGEVIVDGVVSSE
jgi:hypothetical protein